MSSYFVYKALPSIKCTFTFSTAMHNLLGSLFQTTSSSKELWTLSLHHEANLRRFVEVSYRVLKVPLLLNSAFGSFSHSNWNINSSLFTHRWAYPLTWGVAGEGHVTWQALMAFSLSRKISASGNDRLLPITKDVIDQHSHPQSRNDIIQCNMFGRYAATTCHFKTFV